jgi:hypothetical protein
MTTPFIVVAPPFTQTSNGIRVLHKLCGTLNRLGRTAALAIFNEPEPKHQEIVLGRSEQLSEEYDTPLLGDLSRETIDGAYVIYPEILIGNPLQAKRVIRYFGNKEGLCNGQSIGVDRSEFILCHSRVLRKEYDYVLFDAWFHPAFNSEGTRPYSERTLDVSYIGKGYLHGPVGWITDTLWIERGWPRTKEQLALVLRNTRRFITWDSWSAINVEAVLCGALPVFARTEPWTQEEIDNSELGIIPRVDMEAKTAPTAEAYYYHKMQLEKRIAAVAASWEERVAELVVAVDQHFATVAG